ncbi:hypothetical protein ACSBR2_027276 [Camellia fascicularis]
MENTNRCSYNLLGLYILAGLIPEEIGKPPNVRVLALAINNIMRAIPTSIFNSSSL